MPIHTAKWTNTSDPEILRFLDGHEQRIAATPAVIAANTPMSGSHCQRRMLVLRDAGMIEPAPDIEKSGYYQITDLGRKWIRGELRQNELEGLVDED